MADNKDQPQPQRLPQQAGAPSQEAQRSTQDAQRAQEESRKRSAEQLKRETDERANRPQGVGGNPTPTQQENDEIRAGLRHIDDKEEDGSGPDPARRIDEARRRALLPEGQQNKDGSYKTR